MDDGGSFGCSRPIGFNNLDNESPANKRRGAPWAENSLPVDQFREDGTILCVVQTSEWSKQRP